MSRLLAFLLVLGLAGCDGGDPAAIFEGEVAGVEIGDGPVYVSLRAVARGAAAVLPASAAATTQWDLAFDRTEVRLNGGSSGPGTAIGVVLATPFTSVTDALREDVAYRRDGESPCFSGPPRAVCTGPGEGLLAETDGQIVPVLGRVLLLRLADGRGYAKLQVESVMESPAGEPQLAFRFALNPEGSSFEE